MENGTKKIGVLTSGGDAPGMNAAIRSVTRTAIYHGFKVVGIRKGFNGLINGDIINLSSREVSEIIYRGGTILHSARSKEMLTEEGRQKAANVYQVLNLDAVVVIGGNGSIAGANELSKLGLNMIGVPATIDLDLGCTEYTIGFDTAVNTGMEAINRLRDTSSSHERCSVIEVMGRHAGYIALWCALAGGAEEVLLPEYQSIMKEDQVIEQVFINRSRGKKHNLIVVAEGIGKSQELAKRIESITGIQTRATILGHLQRGGQPTALDRIQASMMGHKAVSLLLENKKNRIVIYRDGKYADIDFETCLQENKVMNDEMYKLVKILAI